MDKNKPNKNKEIEKEMNEEKMEKLKEEIRKKDCDLFRYEIIGNVNETINNQKKSAYIIISIFLAFLTLFICLLTFLGYENIKNSLLKQIDIDKIKQKVLVSAQNELKEVEEIKNRILEIEIKTAETANDLQKSTEALGEHVYATVVDDSLASKLPTGWTFFAQQYRNSIKFSMQAFKVVKTSSKKRSKSYPYKGDIVKCIIPLQFVRTGPPLKSKMRPVIGAVREGDSGRVINTKEIRDTKGNDEIWIKIEPVD